MNVKTFFITYSFIKNQCYLIYENNIGILIDPAWDYDLINNFLLTEKITLQGILLTHSHLDHTNLAEKFAQTYDVPVFMGDTEITTYQFNCINLVPVNHLQEIPVSGFNIISILTPGHTAGSMCYLIEEHLFSGDTIFIEGVGICVGKGSDAGKMYDSVQFLKTYLNRNTLFWPGHSFGESPGKNLHFLLLNNIYFQFTNKNHFVNFRMRKSQPDPFGFS
jgi:hydroxyacylglutathione hydrolase